MTGPQNIIFKTAFKLIRILLLYEYRRTITTIHFSFSQTAVAKYTLQVPHSQLI